MGPAARGNTHVFFRGPLAGEHKAKQDLTTLFYQALYAECQRRNIPPTWSAENSQLVHEVAAQLTFTVATMMIVSPTDHDAPLIQLPSIKHNPLSREMTAEQLTALVQKLRHGKAPSTKTIKPPKTNQSATAKAAAYNALLDTL